MELTAEIDGMRAVHCVRAVQTALTAVPGITAIDVTLGRAVVQHDGRATAAAVRDAIGVAGFPVTAVHEVRRRLPLLGGPG
jgi:copper chaperone CopZ